MSADSVLNTKKFAFIASAVLIALSVIPIAIYVLIPNNDTADSAIVNNGVKLVKTLELEDQPDVGFGITTDIKKIRVNDIFLGTNNNVHKINQIRLAQDGSYFVLYQTKRMSRYSSYREFIAAEFEKTMVENVLTFVEDKKKVEYSELRIAFEELEQANKRLSELRAEDDRLAQMAMARSPEPSQEEPVYAAVAPPSPPTDAPEIVPINPENTNNIHVIDDVELATIIPQEDVDPSAVIDAEEFEQAKIVEYVEME